MSGTSYNYTALTPSASSSTYTTIAAEEAYHLQQAREEAARRARDEAARREAERRARVEAERLRVREQSMAVAAQRYRAMNPQLIAPTPTAVKLEAARAETTSKQSSEAALQNELRQTQATNRQRALDAIAQVRQQFADQQHAADVSSAMSALEDAKTLVVESQMWIAAGAPGDSAQAGRFAEQIKGIEAAISANPDASRRQAETLVAQLRTQRDEMARAHFRRWSDLLVDCGFEQGRIQGLQERLRDNDLNSASGPRVAELEAALTAAGKALSAVMDHEQEYTLNLEDVSSVLDSARTSYDGLAESTFELIAESQQRKTAETIASALAALGYRDSMQRGATPQVGPLGSQLQVIALRQDPNTKTPDEKVAAFFVDKAGGVVCDFSGYADRECEAAASDVFAELRRRGLVLINQDAAVRLRNADPMSISTNPQAYAGAEFAPILDDKKRQPELRRRVLKALKRMGFTDQEIQEKVLDGNIIIGASRGNIAYRVTLTPKGNSDQIPEEITHDTDVKEVIDKPIVQPVPPTPRPSSWRRADRARSIMTGR